MCYSTRLLNTPALTSIVSIACLLAMLEAPLQPSILPVQIFASILRISSSFHTVLDPEFAKLKVRWLDVVVTKKKKNETKKLKAKPPNWILPVYNQVYNNCRPFNQ